MELICRLRREKKISSHEKPQKHKTTRSHKPKSPGFLVPLCIFGWQFYRCNLRNLWMFIPHAGMRTPGIKRMMMRCRRATRFGFTWGLKTVRGFGIMAERNAASRALRFAAGL